MLALGAIAALGSSCGEEPLDARIQGVIDGDAPSPLNQLLGVQDAAQAGLAQRDSQAQQRIADCMAQSGFVYIPITAEGPASEPGASAFDALTPGSLEQVEADGYGMAGAFLAELDLPASAADLEGRAVPVDPNDEIRDKLSAAELRAYEVALLGYASSEIDLSSGEPIRVSTGQPVSQEDWVEMASGGCQAQAYEQAFDLRTGQITTRFIESIGTKLSDMEAAFRADQRFVDLQDDWVRCMADEGYDYRSREDILAHLEQMYGAVPVDRSGDDPVSAEVLARVEEVKAAEVELAVADWRCSAGFFAEVGEIRRKYEVAFLRENAGIILAYLDEVAAEQEG